MYIGIEGVVMFHNELLNNLLSAASLADRDGFLTTADALTALAATLVVQSTCSAVGNNKKVECL